MKVKVKLLSCVWLFVTLWTVARQETYITIQKIVSQWEFVVCFRELKQGLCINLEGWDGEGDGREFQQGGDICIPMAVAV